MIYPKCCLKYLLTLLFIFPFILSSSPLDEIKKMNKLFDRGIKVDLRSPTFKDDVLSTDQGGVVRGPNIRIQAQNIRYTKKIVDGTETLTVEASGDVALEFGLYFFVGEHLEYDFIAKKGVIYSARSAVEPWYFGGDSIELLPDNTYIVHHGFITTSENHKTDWHVAADIATLKENHLFRADNVKFKFLQLPLLLLK